MLQVERFSKRFGRVHALSDVTFSIRPGEVLGLIGPNGSGKTTLFECLGGVLPADSGTLRHEGRPLSEDERWMLGFSEYDPEFVVDVERVGRFEEEVPSEEYEARIAGLIERAAARDAAADAGAADIYRQAYRVVKRGEHYLVIMLKPGLRRWLRPWWAFWR